MDHHAEKESRDRGHRYSFRAFLLISTIWPPQRIKFFLTVRDSCENISDHFIFVIFSAVCLCFLSLCVEIVWLSVGLLTKHCIQKGTQNPRRLNSNVAFSPPLCGSLLFQTWSLSSLFSQGHLHSEGLRLSACMNACKPMVLCQVPAKESNCVLSIGLPMVWELVIYSVCVYQNHMTCLDPKNKHHLTVPWAKH